ncbi:MAG: serine/threonine-protein kinase [Verrucomicrobiota bacterium]
MKVFAPGEIIASRYVVQSSLGEGGLGAVYLCQLAGTDQFVAIKVIKPDTGVDLRLIQDLLKREARILSGLRHKNIVQLHDFIEDQYGPLFVMEYVNGYTISDPAMQGPYAFDSFLSCAMQCLEGLAAAHRKDLLHLDIKPENIMVVFGKDGGVRVKILDFGISQVMSELQEAAAGDEIIGSAFYIAPEQLQRNPSTPATDLYSLGHVFYLMLAGETAYQADDINQLVLLKIKEEAQDIRYYREDLPEAFVEWLHRMIAIDSSQRPQSCQQAIKELTAISIRSLTPLDPQPNTIGRRISQSLRDLLDDMNLNG